jgi:large subunit ribosomal protein L15
MELCWIATVVVNCMKIKMWKEIANSPIPLGDDCGSPSMWRVVDYPSKWWPTCFLFVLLYPDKCSISCRFDIIKKMKAVIAVNGAKAAYAGQRLVTSAKASQQPRRLAVVQCTAQDAASSERLRLDNLSPQDGSRRKKTRKGRGYGAGQGGTAGYGMRGQKSRSGSGIRPGFEGGQTPLYRKLPKLKGIAGGMGHGLPDYVTINVRDLNKFAGEDGEVSLELLKEKKILNLSGRQDKLPLKILGTGELSGPVTVHAAAFSASAKEKIEAAGGTVVTVPQKEKWTRAAHEAAKAQESS